MGHTDIHYTIINWIAIFALACLALEFAVYLGAKTVRSIRRSLKIGRKDD